MAIRQSLIISAVASFPSEHKPYINELLDHLSEVHVAERLGDWEKVGVRGGKFCEVAASYIKALGEGALDGKITKPKNMVEACRSFEQFTALPRSIRIQIPRILVCVYEFRNNSGFAHVSNERVALKADARVISQNLRWAFSVFCDAYSNLPTGDVDKVVELMSAPTAETVWTYGEAMAVTVPGLNAREEALLILSSRGGDVSIEELAAGVAYQNKSRFKREVLKEMEKRKEIKVVGAEVHLLPEGFARAVLLT